MVEPWLRGTLEEIDPVRRQILHALELAEEDCTRWAGNLSPEELETRPFGLASAGFHLRHIARSLDRLLTYAEDRQLSDDQLAALRSEMVGSGNALQELRAAIATAKTRILNLHPATFAEARGVGRERLPTTVAGLLVHCAEHTQRHTGQLVTTAGVIQGMRVQPLTNHQGAP